MSTTTIFETLSDGTRRGLLDAMRDEEQSVNDLVRLVGLSQPGVSRHLRILREAGLVEVRRNAQRRLYRARPNALVDLDEWLAPYRRYWVPRLDALTEHLDATAPLGADDEEVTR